MTQSVETLQAPADTFYHGWTNYETWLVALWLDDNQTSHHHWMMVAKKSQTKAASDVNVIAGIWTVEETAKYRLADRLKQEMEENIPDSLPPSMYVDLMAEQGAKPAVGEHWNFRKAWNSFPIAKKAEPAVS
jgi:hypothetical protein